MFHGHGNMKILGLIIGHDASACVIEDGKIVYYRMAERLSRVKHDYNIFPCLQDLVEENFVEFDTIIVSYFLDRAKDEFIKNQDFINENFSFNNLKLIKDQHHLHHAFGALYSSGYNDAVVIVLDGSGSINYNLVEGRESREIESIYYIDLSQKSVDTIYKHYHSDIEERIVNNNIEISNDISVGWAFERCAENIGFDIWSAGKVMGLSQYLGHEQLLEDQWKNKVFAAYECQTATEARAEFLLYKAITSTSCKNIVITGGYGLNCLANFKYSELLHRNYNLYIDPICFDAGISIGAAFKEYVEETNYYFPKHIKNVFIGNKKSYDLKNYNAVDTTEEYILQLIENQEPVAVYYGNSEAGQRALGHRSILFDPRNPNGKDLMNTIKNRESFRPFGCSVLIDLAFEWFRSDTITSSPFMTYAVPVREKYKKYIPAVVHIDGTSRIQTLDPQNNEYLYSLVEKFYKKTGIPLLGNTSLNLAGEPLVETLEDAVNVLHNSDLKYLYLPKEQKLITV